MGAVKAIAGIEEFDLYYSAGFARHSRKHPLPPQPHRFRFIISLTSGADRCRLLPHFASAARITRLPADPDQGMAGRCVQGLIDVLEGNYGGDVTKMPYVVNKEAFV